MQIEGKKKKHIIFAKQVNNLRSSDVLKIDPTDDLPRR